MKHKKGKFFSHLIIVAILLIFQESKAQSAWSQKKGEIYSHLSYSLISNYSDIYSKTAYSTTRKISDNTLQLYGEYGLSDKLTLIVSLPLKSISTGTEVAASMLPLSIDKGSKTALGNVIIGIKHKIFDRKFVLSGQLNMEANTGSSDLDLGIRTGLNAWTFTPTLNFGRGYNNYYVQAFSGIALRTNNYSSNFKLGGEFGWTSIKNITLIGFIDIVASFKNGTVMLPNSTFETALYLNNQEYTAVGLKAVYHFTDNFGFTMGLGGALSANNVPKQLALSGGLFYQLK